MAIVCVVIKIVAEGTSLHDGLIADEFAEQNVCEIDRTGARKDEGLGGDIQGRIRQGGDPDKGTVGDSDSFFGVVHDMELHVVLEVFNHGPVVEYDVADVIAHEAEFVVFVDEVIVEGRLLGGVGRPWVREGVIPAGFAGLLPGVEILDSDCDFPD